MTQSLATIIVIGATFSFAHATTVFSGTGTSGTAQGQSWIVNFDAGSVYGEDDWGMPGAFNGLEAWVNPATDFIEFGFTLPAGVTIDPATVATNCANDSPCMKDLTTGDTWTPILAPGNLVITFYAPGNDFLNPNDQFYVNMFFTSSYSGSDMLSTSGLSFIAGAFVEPEPASVALLGVGLLGLGLTRQRWLRKN